MIFVSASKLSPFELASLGNNILPARRRCSRSRTARTDRRVVAAVNRSLESLEERIDHLHPVPFKPSPAQHVLAS